MYKYRSFIFQGIIILFIFFVTAQTIILQRGRFPTSLNSDGNEVKSVGVLWYNDYSRGYTVVVKIIQGPLNGKVRIIVNGEKVFSFKGEEILLSLRGGDLLWLDARGAREPVWLRITDSNIKSGPFISGKEFRAFRELIFLGEVNEAGRL